MVGIGIMGGRIKEDENVVDGNVVDEFGNGIISEAVEDVVESVVDFVGVGKVVGDIVLWMM